MPVLVGGDTDFLLGIQYNFFLPRPMFMLPSGLGIYESMFVGVDGTRGCIGGAHQLFTQCEKQFLEVNSLNSITDFRVYLNQQLSLFRSGYKVCLDHNALTVENSFQPHHVAIVYEDADVPCTSVLVASKTKLLGDHADAARSGIDYRCVKCRGCNDCKNGERIEYICNIDMFKHISCCIFVAILVFRHKDTLLDKSSNNFRGQLTIHGSKFHHTYLIV